MLDQLREDIALYLTDMIDADELQRRLPDGWETDQTGDETITRLVLRILGYLSDFQNGNLGESDLTDRLRLVLPSARTYWIDPARVTWLEQAQRTVASGSAARIIPRDVREESGISRVAESV